MSNNFSGVWIGKGNELAAYKKEDDKSCPKSRCDKVCMKIVIAQKCRCPELYVVELHYKKPERTTETITMYKIDGVLCGAHASGNGVVSLKFNRNYVTLRYSVAQPDQSYFAAHADMEGTVASVSAVVSLKKRKCKRKCECECEESSCNSEPECDCRSERSCQSERSCECDDASAHKLSQ